MILIQLFGNSRIYREITKSYVYLLEYFDFWKSPFDLKLIILTETFCRFDKRIIVEFSKNPLKNTTHIYKPLEA